MGSEGANVEVGDVLGDDKEDGFGDRDGSAGIFPTFTGVMRG